MSSFSTMFTNMTTFFLIIWKPLMAYEIRLSTKHITIELYKIQVKSYAGSGVRFSGNTTRRAMSHHPSWFLRTF